MHELALALLSACFGITFSVMKRALQDASPAVFLTLRFAIATTLFGLLLVVRRERWSVRSNLTRHGALLGLSMLGGNILQTYGLRLTSSTHAAFLTGLQVLLVPFLALSFYGHALKRSSFIAVGLALLGMLLLTRPFGDASTGSAHLGDTLAVLCAGSFGLRTLWASEWTPLHALLPLTFVQIAVTFAGSLVLLPFEPLHLNLSLYLVGTLAFIAVIMTVLGLLVQNWAQRRVSATRAALISAVEPLSAALFAHFYAGDPLTFYDWMGGGLVVAAIATVQLGGANLARQAT